MTIATLSTYRDDRLSLLSWLFRLGANGAHLTCGMGVESTGDGFFEGAWAGSFIGQGIHQCPNVFGSGGRYTPDGWILVPSSHTLDAIYILQTADAGWFASNSLAFLTSAAGIRLPFHSFETWRVFVEILHGISNSPRYISTERGRLYLLNYCNATLVSDLQIRPKPTHEGFRQYHDYRAYLCNVLKATAENAAHPDRRTRYKLLATVSSGYDSPACATLARSVGCVDGVTFLKSRDGESDDGSAIGHQLGLRMTGVQHPLFSDASIADGTRAAEFFAPGMLGEDITYAALSGVLRERVLITGFHGDKIWDRYAKPTADLRRSEVSGTSLSEFRLRENFIHLPLPFVGARQDASVQAISNSSEMAPYMVGGLYDRPIPRRIVEEAGVRREHFGQRKKAVGTLIFDNDHRRRIPEAMRRAVEAYVRKQSIPARIRYQIKLAWYAAGMVAMKIGRRLPARLARIYKPIARSFWPPFPFLDPFAAYATNWALNEVGQRYQHSICRPFSKVADKNHVK